MLFRIARVFGIQVLLQVALFRLFCDGVEAKPGGANWNATSSFRVAIYADTGTALQKCKANIKKADTDENSKLVADEYADFIEIQSGGVINSEFEDLDTSFISVFQTVACRTCLEDTGEINCCVGSDAFIPLTLPDSDEETAMYTFICTQVNRAIREFEPPESPVPSAVPSRVPETIPSVAPTDEPTDEPTVRLTKEPTTRPTVATTPSPTDLPTNEPTAGPTRAPVTTPVTSTPTTKPTVRPTSSPSVLITNLPTATPSISPTIGPTSTPTTSPTTGTPTVSPTLAPTLPPKCVSFGYTLENQAGLTAQDILDGNNNTVKLGLEIATRTITIQILNETLPETDFRPVDNNLLYVRRHRRRQLEQLKGTPRALETRNILDTVIGDLHTWNRAGNQLTRLLYASSRRHLVFYTDELPPVVTNVVDNPFCPQGDEDGITLCQLVTTEVCVVLEEGDDPELVQTRLIAGFRLAIETGEFFQAIPPEHLPVG